VKDLRAVLTTAIEKQSDIILTDNFNNVISDTNNNLTILMSSLNFIDLHADKNSFDYELATYRQGKRRLDYIFVSQRLIDHVIHCVYEKYDARIVSDH